MDTFLIIETHLFRQSIAILLGINLLTDISLLQIWHRQIRIYIHIRILRSKICIHGEIIMITMPELQDKMIQKYLYSVLGTFCLVLNCPLPS